MQPTPHGVNAALPIKVLPQTLINQIAAGEVIVRMASVVKELVENSIDAASTRIEIRLSDDSRNLEIIDDGCGMNRDDAELCLQRHATSKIQSVDDLFNLHTRGFRGEAMPSIASVSRLEIQTRPRNAIMGTRLAVEGGRIERIEAFGCPPGTRIIVRDLFFNTPARRKFLKSSVGEMNAALVTITRQALAQPGVGFRVLREDRVVIEVPAGQSLVDRFRSILGSEIKKEPLPLWQERGDIMVAGVMAHPGDARGDRRSQFLFVNERPFSAKSIVASFEQACRGYVMTRRFPIFCVFIHVPPAEVDFNVHPTKEEVRFQDERSIAGAVYHAALGALQGSPALVQSIELPDNQPREHAAGPAQRIDNPAAGPATRPEPPPPAFFTSPEQLARRYFERKQERASQSDWLAERDRARTAPPSATPPPSPKSHLPPPVTQGGEQVAAGPGEQPDNSFWERGIEPEPLGQIAETYILVRYGEDLLVIDQHAVHERLVYLQLCRREKRIDAQSLLIPITIELEPAQSETLGAILPELASLGFEISEFGPRTWAVHSLPADLPEFDPVPMLIELIGDMEEARRVNALEDMRDRILIRTACHSAIRAGQQLATQEMYALLAQVKAERLSFTCPHGRPTIVRLSKGELDKQFKRVL